MEDGRSDNLPFGFSERLFEECWGEPRDGDEERFEEAEEEYPELPDPDGCPFALREVGGHVECSRSGRRMWVSCREGICGDEPTCCWGEPDNSDEARERRLAWLSIRDRG